MEPVAESSSRSHRSYTRAFKLHVVAEYFHSDESYREVAQRNHISSANTVRHWCSQYHRVIEDADMMRANQEGNAALDAAHLSDAELQLVACEAMKMSVYNLSAMFATVHCFWTDGKPYRGITQCYQPIVALFRTQ